MKKITTHAPLCYHDIGEASGKHILCLHRFRVLQRNSYTVHTGKLKKEIRKRKAIETLS
jgi:hypothetical protein